MSLVLYLQWLHVYSVPCLSFVKDFVNLNSQEHCLYIFQVMNPESELMQKIESNQANLPRLSNSNNSLQRDPHIDLSSSTDRTLSDNQVNSLSSGSVSEI